MAIFPNRRFHRQMVDIGLEILFALPPAPIQPLPEVSLPVKQSYTDQRNIQIRCALDVITSQHSQSAGINRQ